ncbi:hypothetical protein [Bacillus pseudomycoides]|nr:hypothetical protein [Bacillus pseudomycoides]
MTKQQLINYATDHNIVVPSTLLKDEIREILEKSVTNGDQNG